MSKGKKVPIQPVHLRVELSSPPPGCQGVFVSDKITISVGRSETNDIVLKDASVSRKHMRFLWSDRTVYAEDMNSKNGTFLKVQKKWQKIKDRRLITLPASLKVGNVIIHVDTQQPEDTPIKKKEFLNSMIPTTGKKYKEQEKFQGIMVLDLCESSKLANTDEKMAFHLKMRLESIAKRILDRTKADFYKSTGDGFIATFDNIMNAFDAANSLLDVLKTRNERTPNPNINVRIALHAGKTHIFGEKIKDIYGPDVDITFRLEHVQSEAFLSLQIALPYQNRILCSKRFVQELSSSGLDITTFKCCGIAQLKGIKDPPEVYLAPTP